MKLVKVNFIWGGEGIINLESINVAYEFQDHTVIAFMGDKEEVFVKLPYKDFLALLEKNGVEVVG